MRISKYVLATSLMTMAIAAFMPAKANAAGSVVSSGSVYTYGEMIQDIDALCHMYPGIVSYSSIGTSSVGLGIPMITLGNPCAPHCIMIQSAIHGREYATANMTMKIVEYYASNYAVGNMADLYNNTCFYIVPMSNPDGVTIAQTSNCMWKANGIGVDLNRNFDINWNSLDSKGVYQPCSENFKGYTPVSENETKALIALAKSRNFDCYISYHQAGNVIYFDDNGTSEYVSNASAALAATIANCNGYTLRNLKVANAKGETTMGGFNDWVQVCLNKPGVTVECGTAYGQGQVNSIYKKNCGTWNNVARLYW